METSIIRDWSSVLSLSEEWNHLLGNSDADGLFSSWEWLSSWIDIVKDKNSPYFIIIRNNENQLVGVAPFYLVEAKLFGIISYKTLRLAADHSTGFEYADLIIDKAEEQTALEEIGRSLYSNQTDWDLIWLPKIAGWSDSLKRIEKAISEPFSFPSNARQIEFSYIQLPESIDQYNATFSSKKRNQNKRLKKRVFQDPTTAFINCDEPAKLELYLNALFTLHHKRRRLLGDPGTFIRRPSQVAFYKNFVPKALKNGWIKINAIESQGEIQAIQLGYVRDKAYLQMQEGFNPDFVKGAGNVLRHHMIEQCINEGLTEYDFLGGFTEHKRRWGAKKRLGKDILIGNRSLKTRLIMKYKFWPTGRYLKEKSLVD